MYSIKMIIYFSLLILLATVPLWLGGIFMDKNKTLAYIFGFFYIPYFIALGLFGIFQKASVVLKNFIGL